jgi:hypothetical protein
MGADTPAKARSAPFFMPRLAQESLFSQRRPAFPLFSRPAFVHAEVTGEE